MPGCFGSRIFLYLFGAEVHFILLGVFLKKEGRNFALMVTGQAQK